MSPSRAGDGSLLLVLMELDMIYDAETLTRVEEALDIINDYTIDLYYLSIQNKIKHYVDFVACWECLDDLKCAYREIVEKTQCQ